MAFGTDTTPHNMLEEIRKAGTFSRIASHDVHDVSTGMLFHAATIGGAKALMRDDISRLAADCKADIVAVDRSEEHTSELQSLMRISYAVFCLEKKTKPINQ